MKRSPLKRYTPLHRNGQQKHADEHRAWVQMVAARALHRCESCGVKPGRRGPLDPHHLFSRARGGKDRLWNGVLLCRTCHRAVHDHTVTDWSSWLASSEREARAIRRRLDG